MDMKMKSLWRQEGGSFSFTKLEFLLSSAPFRDADRRVGHAREEVGLLAIIAIQIF